MRTHRLAGLFLIAVALVSCSTTQKVPGLKQLGEISGLVGDEEQRIASVLNAVAKNTQSRELNRVMAHVSPQYKDAAGRDYEGIREYLRKIFKRYHTIRITRVAPEIYVEGQLARVIETFGTRAEPEDASRYAPINMQGNVTVFLEKSSGTWKIVEWSALE